MGNVIANSANIGKLKSVTNALNQVTYYSYQEIPSPTVAGTFVGTLTRQWGAGVYPTETLTDLSGRTVELRTFRTGDFLTASWPATTAADVTKWSYDAFTGALLSKTYATAQPGVAGASQQVQYNYHPNGQLFHRIWQSGRTTTYLYTNFNQLWKLTYDANSQCAPVTYTYDLVTGRMATCLDAAGLHTYTYEEDGAPATENITAAAGSASLLAGASQTSLYDAQHRRRRLESAFSGQTIPATDYYYSPLGRLSRIAAAGRSVDYAYVPQSDLLERRDAKVGLGETGTRVLASTHVYDRKGNLQDVENVRQAPYITAALAACLTSKIEKSPGSA